MKKVGREVLFLKTGEDLPRNGEGTFLRLKNGSILFAYTKFSGERNGDGRPADIAVIVSCDEGETWSEPKIIFSHDAGAGNYMVPSLLRMNNGDVGITFLRKDKTTNGAVPYFARSADEGKTWSEPKPCIDDPNYFVIENDHTVILRSGRILIPANLHSDTLENGELKLTGRGKMCMFASDDDGAAWARISDYYEIPFAEKSETGLQETAVYQMEDGTLWALSRTDLGFQFESFSTDDGATWTQAEPNRFFSSPTSPLLMKPAGKYTVAVFNPIPEYTTRISAPDRTWGRTPLVCAVSDDGGKTFPRIFYIEDDPDNGYCYPAIFAGDDYLLVAYYHSENRESPLRASKIVKIGFDELQ